MGLQELITKGRTKQETVKPKVLESEMKVAEPPTRKITREESLPSPFDSMYMYPLLDIKGQAEVVTLQGEITGEQRKKQRPKVG